MKHHILAGMMALGIPAGTYAQTAAHPPVPRDRERWIQGDNYPAAAFAVRAQGTTRFTLMVNAKGRVTDCRITESSGNASLDGTACALHVHNARFFPAIDDAGNPIVGEWSGKTVWILPR